MSYLPLYLQPPALEAYPKSGTQKIFFELKLSTEFQISEMLHY